MWEALDQWKRKEFLKALAERLGAGQMKPVQAKQEKGYCNWEADTVGVKYWADWESMEIYGFFPTDKMTNGMKPFIRLTSLNNTVVVFSCKEDETELFNQVERAFNSMALWDTPEKMINKVMETWDR
jgi:hypothetical protein